MSTVRNIERRMFIRRQVDRDLQGSATGAIAPRASEWGVEWNGIWAGYMVWVGAEAVLLFLVLGIGFSSLNPLHAASWAGVGKGVVIWAVIVTLIATYIGSWVAGRTPPSTTRHGIAKGITLWGMIVLSALLVVGWIGGQAINAAAGAASAVGAAAPTMANTGVTALQGVLQSNGITNVTTAEATDIAGHLAAGDHAGAVTALSTDAGIPAARATTVLNQVAAPTGGTAAGVGRSAAGAVKHGGGSLAWGMFWLVLITLGCAIGGGATGGGGLRRKPVMTPAA